MPNVKWSAAPTSRGNVLTTELDNKGDGIFTGVGPSYDNTVNLDRWAWVQFLAGGSVTPAAGAYINIYLVNSLDGSNYDDPASGTNPGYHQLVATISIQTGAHTVRAMNSVPFALPPGKFKFVLKNAMGVSTAATGNTLALYTSNEAVG